MTDGLHGSPTVAVIGAGVAGLVCAKELEKAGIRAEVFEAADRVGGRVQTDISLGYKMDIGFQIFLDGYPEARRQLDYSSLNLRSFKPGAILASGGGRTSVVAHPLKCPLHLFKTLRTAIRWGLLTVIFDVCRLAKLVFSWFTTRPYEQLRQASKEETTSSFLSNMGLSCTFVNEFLRPFFEAIYVCPLEEQSSAMFNFVLRMLAFGRAALPEQGMGAIPEQLASQLKGEIQLGTSVEAVRDKSIKIAGEWKSYDAVVVATDWPSASKLLGLPAPRATRSATWYYGFEAPAPSRDAMIILQSYMAEDSKSPLLKSCSPGCGEGSRVVNVAFPSVVQSSYAPPGHTLAAVTVTGPAVADAWIRSQVEAMLGIDCSSWQHLRTYDIGFHQPAQLPLQLPEMLEPTVKGVYCCGDHRSYPTLDGTMRSGCLIAEAVSRQLLRSSSP